MGKKVLQAVIGSFMLLILLYVTAYAESPIDYTLDNGILTVTGAKEFEGELILPMPEMGEVDEIIIKFGAFSGSRVTDVKLTAKNRIYIGGTESDFPDRDWDGAFECCNGLKKLDLDAPKVEIDGYAFSDDIALDFVNISCSELIVGKYGFYGCDALGDFNCEASAASIGSYAFVTTDEGDETDYLPWINKKNGFVTLGDTLIAYSGTGKAVVIDNEKLAIDVVRINKNLETVVLTDNVRELPVGDFFGNMFSQMENLVSVRLPSWVKNLSPFMFFGCTKLESVELPKDLEFFSDQVFQECPSLKVVTIPRNAIVLSFGIMNKNPFEGCNNLTLRVYENTPGEEYVRSLNGKIPYMVIPKINFADESMKRAAQIELMSNGEVYEEDLEDVWELTLTGARTLEDAALFPNLTKLSATFGWIDDLSPLSKMGELTDVNLSFNCIRDVAPLKNLNRLKNLNLMGNMISDISPLNELSVRPITLFNYMDNGCYMDIHSDHTVFRLPSFGGQWNYAIYYDGKLLKAGTLTDEDNNKGYYSVNYDGVQDAILLTAKVFLWDSYESLKPYEVFGMWTYPVISSEYIDNIQEVQ